MHDQIKCKKESYRLSSTCGAPRNHTNVPPVDAHVLRQLHLSAVARCSDIYFCFFCYCCSMFFSTGGVFSPPARPADLGAARLGRRGIAKGPAPRESRSCPRPVAGAVHSQNRNNRVSFAGDPSGSALPSRLREPRSARQSFPIQFPYEK